MDKTSHFYSGFRLGLALEVNRSQLAHKNMNRPVHLGRMTTDLNFAPGATNCVTWIRHDGGLGRILIPAGHGV